MKWGMNFNSDSKNFIGLNKEREFLWGKQTVLSELSFLLQENVNLFLLILFKLNGSHFLSGAITSSANIWIITFRGTPFGLYGRIVI